MKSPIFLTAWVSLVAVAGAAAEPPRATPETEFFEKNVRPVLEAHCLKCHGPKKQEASLRVDSRAALLQRRGDNGPAVLPGDPEKSPLVQAIRRAGPVKKMPPKQPLTPRQVAALTTWIKSGAAWTDTATNQPNGTDWKKHWAFQPVRKPDLPAVKDAAWPILPVDRFILARLEAKGLAPSPIADRRTLIRRATFDLIGLPPTPEEIEAASKDESAAWFEKVVDRLLASPHYGERWGRHWLDVARYADNKGYNLPDLFEIADYPWAYTYRDYVIEAFNRDLPYDQFVLQQLAADRLPRADRQALRALGFLTVGGRFMNNTQDILDDRIDVVTRGLMGLTVSCARCHDHKFDPIPSKDYYSLYGVFASSPEPVVAPLYQAPPNTAAYAAFEKELQVREQRLLRFVRDKHTELVQSVRRRVGEYLAAAHAIRNQPDAEDFMFVADGSQLNPRMVHRWHLHLLRTRKKPEPVFAAWHAFAALPEPEFAAKAPEVVRRLTEAKAVNPFVLRAVTAKPPGSMNDVIQRYGELFLRIDRNWQDLCDRAMELLEEPPAALPDAAEEELRQVLYGAESPPMIPLVPFGDLDVLADRASQAKHKALRKALDEWRIKGPGAPPRAMVVEDLPAPYEPRVFLRGNPGNLGDRVPRQFVGFLSGEKRPPFRDGSGRLELARAIVNPQNPLTARVMVNRIWMHHFGSPLVGTPSDFGTRSQPPTNPELLDYLAVTFVENGWSIKKMHRLLMLSRAYQQASHDRPDGTRLDPENTLYWKMNRQRLDFEATRDALLAVSGNLDRTVGGPARRNILATGATRRTVYGYVDRLDLPGLYRTFDYPNPDATSPRRDTTTVTPQALFLMNHPFVLHAAKKLVERPEIAGEKDAARKVERLYRLLYGRAPTERETTLARDFLADRPGAWDRYAHALLMANEFVFVD